ncbi:2,3-bisphosphoglycerate-independent phosphoglycerate mutase [Arenicella xantha]|uniref:2,3-bisphosphoglycerate-independent phosphoglycerate mutase n=1 Tax=Arenicella xantha TaxID=644221 RepID=A0A395JJG3_9GAMM|nr:2,3-bisphosphoglycerate-independent phosphoglycerate mutase [Arenicella xantha]RBP48908.1 phosphoglycerate mutase [Arenicella xantha]
MSLSLKKHHSFAGRPGPVVILVADGVGVAPAGPSNAVTEANTPTLDKLAKQTLYTELAAHGTAVGLPSDDDMGNSEVGHNAIGAGRIFAQGAKLVNQAIASGEVYDTEVWQQAIQHGKANTLHLLGLHSDGNVHSHTQHLYALMQKAADQGVTECCIHILLDGRDVAARSALTYIEQTESLISKINAQYAANFRIASGGGRMEITMDRYEADWDMVRRGYHCHTHGVGVGFESAAQAVEAMYEASSKGDQYLPAFVIEKNGDPVGRMNDGDAVILFNFRGDRAIEISLAYERDDFAKFDRNEHRAHPSLFYAGMLQYDGDEMVPQQYLVNPPQIDRTMGEFLCAEKITSFAISETQKYGHVTFFWNGNRSGYLDKSLETYIEIPSDNIEFNQAPAMKAYEITEKTVELIESGKFRFGRLNLANGDMVGHTGDLAAAIKAMEVVDECVAKIIRAIERQGGVLLYTADHGNADIMYTEKDGVRHPKTSHTLSPVPFAIVDPLYAGEYQLSPPTDAGLTHIAATTINLLGFEAPEDYQPSLLRFS